MTKLWQLVLFWGVIVGFGTGLTAMVLGALVATRWFTARRGLAVGILSASSASGQLLLLPLAAWLADRYGWRVALWPPIVALVVVALVVVLFLVDKPEDVGLKPYGDKGDTPAHVAPPAAFGRAFEILFESTRSATFWVLAGTFFVCGLSTNGLIQTHFIAFCGDYGMPAVAAASTLAMMGVFDFIGTIGSGWLSDRFDNRGLLSMYYGLRGLSLLYLPSTTFTVYGLSLFAVFYGLDWIATVPPTVKLSAAHFGRERAGVTYGWIFASHMLGAAVAAWGGGFFRSTFNTYLPAFYVAGFACLIAAAAVWLIGGAQTARERLLEARA
jgi:sugar phosphate permease